MTRWSVRRIRTEQAALDDCIEKCSTLQITVATTEKPYRIELQFATPYAYSAAQLIAEFDAAARSVLTVKHVGLMNGALAECALGRCAAAIRSLFAVPQGFRVLRIDRQAVRAGSKAAKAAADLMGELPQAVLLGEHAASLTPRRLKAPRQAHHHDVAITFAIRLTDQPAHHPKPRCGDYLRGPDPQQTDGYTRGPAKRVAARSAGTGL